MDAEKRDPNVSYAATTGYGSEPPPSYSQSQATTTAGPTPYQLPPYIPPTQGTGYPTQPGVLTSPATIVRAVTVQPAPRVVTVVATPAGRVPCHMVCPNCGVEIDTSVKSEPGAVAYLSGLLICLFGCWLGCCLIPCCMEECMDVHHSCPNCNVNLGRFSRIG